MQSVNADCTHFPCAEDDLSRVSIVKENEFTKADGKKKRTILVKARNTKTSTFLKFNKKLIQHSNLVIKVSCDRAKAGILSPAFSFNLNLRRNCYIFVIVVYDDRIRSLKKNGPFFCRLPSYR